MSVKCNSLATLLSSDVVQFGTTTPTGGVKRLGKTKGTPVKVRFLELVETEVFSLSIHGVHHGKNLLDKHVAVEIDAFIFHCENIEALP